MCFDGVLIKVHTQLMSRLIGGWLIGEKPFLGDEFHVYIVLWVSAVNEPANG